MKELCVTRDRKKKRFVGETGNQGSNKKIKTESGQWINASYKSDAYGVIIILNVVCLLMSLSTNSVKLAAMWL